MRFCIGSAIVSIRLPIRSPVQMRRFPGAFELNGHRVYPHYGVGITRLGFGRYDPGDAWRFRSSCLRCGQSIQGGADAYWASVPCGRQR